MDHDGERVVVVDTMDNNSLNSELPTIRHRRNGVDDQIQEQDRNSMSSLSVEQLFEDQVVPSWRRQLTFRALVVSFVLSIFFSFIVMKLNLTTGIIPSLNVSAGLLGFFFIKTWTKLLKKSGFGMMMLPFTRQENTVIQTCVVASSGIAFSGNLNYTFRFKILYNRKYALKNRVGKCI